MKKIETATEVQAKASDTHAQHHVGRLAVTLNVGLVGNVYSGLPQALRAKAYAEDITVILANKGHYKPVDDTVLLLQSFWPATDASWSGLNGEAVAWSERVTENTDVITFDIIRDPARGTWGSAEEVVSALTHRLAASLHQQAIAARWVDEGARDISNRIQGEGVYGPQALAWGAFTPAHWQPFLSAALNEPARFPTLKDAHASWDAQHAAIVAREASTAA